MKKIEAVIFDWAGTTVDYGSFAPVQAFMEAFRRFGITPTADEVRKPMGIAKIDHVREMLKMDRLSMMWQEVHGREYTEDDVREIYEMSERLIIDIVADFAVPKPYVLETIEQLRERDIKIGSTTGYNDEMMEIVATAAAQNGFVPDVYFTPDSVDKIGRPYPYLIYQNMMALKVKSVDGVIKVGDTVADIIEGKNAGVVTVGIVEGSSILGYSLEEYEALTPEEKLAAKERVVRAYKECGTDYIIDDIRGLIDVINGIEQTA